ncbi:hypothetical protein GCM10028801_26560 [Nocardioides maradonensis]
MQQYGGRTKRLPAPQWVVWESLTEPHAPRARPWLNLRRGEVEPTVLEAVRPDRVVWSSLWPDRPRDRVVFELSGARDDTRLRFTLLTPDAPPDESTAASLGKRMSHLIFADLRFSYGQ